MPDLLLILIGTVLVNHFVLGGLPGINDRERNDPWTATVAIALSTGFVTLVAAALSFGAKRWLLMPLGSGHLDLLAVVAAASGTTWLASPYIGRRTTGSRPLIMANGIALVLAMQNATTGRGGLAGAAIAISLAIAFGILLLAFTELLARIEQNDVPRAFRGAPIAFVTAGLAALALLGLSGVLPG